MINSKKIRLPLLDIYLGVVCLFPLTTILVKDGIWNKLMFVILFVSHVGMILSRPIKKKRAIVLILLIVHYLYVLLQTSFPMENINMLFYYPFFILYTFFMNDNMALIVGWFQKNKRYIRLVIYTWSFLVGISILFPGSYYVKEGGTLYFGSFCGDIFRLGPAAVFIQVITLICQTIYGQRKMFFFMIIPMYSFMMGSSRTYMVVGFLLFVISWYLFCRKRTVFWGTIIPMGLIVLMLISVSAMADKIVYSLDSAGYGGFLFRFSSSRNVIWTECISAWKNEGIIHKLLGCGLEFTQEVTGRWAHNDFLEILCSFGIVGMLQYVFTILGLLRANFRCIRIPLMIKSCAIMVWFFNACFNMHYVYFCATLCYPFLLFVLRWYFSKNPMELKWQNDG